MSNASQFNSATKTYSQSLWDQLNASYGQAAQNMSGINQGIAGYNGSMQGLVAPPEGSQLSDAQTGAQGVMNQYDKTLAALTANPGYTQAEQAGMRQSVTNPISSAYGTAQYQNTAGAARTGNAGAATANNAALAREKSRAMSTGLSGLQENIGQARIAGTNEALSASALPGQYASQVLQGQQGNQQLAQFPTTVQAGLYNTNLGNQANLNGQQGNVVGDYLQRAQKPGFLSSAASSALSGLTGTAGAVAAGH